MSHASLPTGTSPSPSDDPIFQPLTVNGVTFKNRIFRSSISGRLDFYDGSMSEAKIAWETRFARGGVGAVISPNSGIRPDGMAIPGYATIADDSSIPSWRRLVDEVHKHDCRYIIQLHFSGRQRDLPRKEFTDVLPLSATEKPDLLYGLKGRQMTIPEINQLVQDYAQAARRAQEAGADGIEIVACNGYLLHQFLGSAINTRDDDYNGDLRARARLILEVLRAVRAEVGPEFLISMKLSARDAHDAFAAPLVREVGNTLEETMELSKWLADAGLDVIHLSQGDSFPHPMVPAGRLPTDDARRLFAALYYEGTRTALAFRALQYAPIRRLVAWIWGRRMPYMKGHDLLPDVIEGMSEHDAARIKQASGLPVICVGGWQSAGRIRSALTADRCDVVSIARGLVANPDLVHQFAQGQDAPERPCTYCNKCMINVVEYPLACWEEDRFDSPQQMYDQAYRVYQEAAVGTRAS